MSLAASEPPSRRLTVAHLFMAVPWVALVIGSWRPIRDNSFLWHIRAGTLQSADTAVIVTDPFSFTMQGEPWRTQSWLVELLYDWAEGLTGLGFVPYMILSVTALTFLGIGLVAYRFSGSVPTTAVVLILSTLILISFLQPRPIIFSYLLMILVILAWDRRTTRWTVPLLFWIWAAVHASFIIGLGYVGLSLIMRREWRVIPTAVLSGLVTLATAHGFGVVTFLLDFEANRDALRYLTEWRRPNFFEPVFLPFIGGVVYIVIGGFRERILPRHLWLVVPFLILGMSSVRAIPPAWLALIPLVALSLSGLEIGSRAGLRLRLAAVYGVVVLGFPFLLTTDADLSEERFPIEARAHLDDLPTFHDDRSGGFLIWSDGPELKVYIDDRAELYGDRMGEFVALRSGDLDWQAVFERDGIEQALLANWEPLLLEDLTHAGWRTAYRDEHFTILRP